MRSSKLLSTVKMIQIRKARRIESEENSLVLG